MPRLENVLLEHALLTISTLVTRGHERSDKTLLMSAVCDKRIIAEGTLGPVFFALRTRLCLGPHESFEATLLELVELGYAGTLPAIESAIEFVEVYRDRGYVFAKPVPGIADKFCEQILESLRTARALVLERDRK